MALFKRKQKQENEEQLAVAKLGRKDFDGFQVFERYSLLMRPELELYDAMRESIPIIDAAIGKTVRLIGDFTVLCDDAYAEQGLKTFLREVRVGPSSAGISAFLTVYFDNLLTYGTALGEMVPTADYSDIGALYNASLYDVDIEKGDSPMEARLFVKNLGTGRTPVDDKSLVLMTALNPPAGGVVGTSVLRGLPFVSSLLVQIFRTIGVNWDRLGNARFAVTCKQAENAVGGSASSKAKEIASAWQSAMSGDEVKDFIAVGDVDIKVIGADNPILDSSVPVKQLEEQIVAKLGIPPFMLGLSWSSTERMSTQQADILTSELEYYRTLLNPVIMKICRTWLRVNGFDCGAEIVWSDVNLQDEVELAKAELYRAQAAAVRAGLEGGNA